MPEEQTAVDAEYWDDVYHETRVALCDVEGSDLGELVYSFYVEDPYNLGHPIGFVMYVSPEGALKLELVHSGEMLAKINPDHHDPEWDRDFEHVPNLFVKSGRYRQLGETVEE